MFRLFMRGIMPDPSEVFDKKKHVTVGREHEQHKLDLSWSDYVAMYIAIVRTLLPYVLLVGVAYSAFVYFFLEIWLK